MKLEKVIYPIKNEMLSFRKLLKKSISSNNILIDEVINYILKRKGKQIRPVIVFLSSGFCNICTNPELSSSISNSVAILCASPSSCGCCE